MKAFALVCLLVAAVQAKNDIDWNNVWRIDITPEGYKYFPFSIEPRIIGGKEATPGQFPYQAAVLQNLESEGHSFCGGSLLSEEWILTAAHCVDQGGDLTVILGAHVINDANETTQVRVSAKKTIVHEKWSPKVLQNDLAVIQLAEKVTLNDRISPIRLPSVADASRTFKGYTGTVSGWGLDSDSATTVSPVLRWVQNNIIGNTVCKIYFMGVIQSTNICLSGSSKKSTCSGDSGGPLVITEDDNKPSQVGIVSFGINLGCEKGWPSAFTRVSSYVGWISQKTGIAERL